MIQIDKIIWVQTLEELEDYIIRHAVIHSNGVVRLDLEFRDGPRGHVTGHEALMRIQILPPLGDGNLGDSTRDRAPERSREGHPCGLPC